MGKVIITISREYGSGGRIIGQRVAELLGIPFYSRNIIDMIAHRSGLDKEYIERFEQYVSSPEIWGIRGVISHIRGDIPAGWSNWGLTGMLPRSEEDSSAGWSKRYYSDENRMYIVQSNIIRELAKESSCVIVGRCANYILRDQPCCLNVMIRADAESKEQRIRDEYKGEEANIFRVMKAVDKCRATYYNRHTGRTWEDYTNYDLVLNSGLFGLEGCAKLIADAAKEKYDA